MSVPQHQAGQSVQPGSARSLAGTLAKTPVPRLLMSASGARVTGTLELSCAESGETATIVLVRGAVTKVKTSAPVAYLGSVLYELGYIDSETLNDSLRELSRVKWLHGEILLTRAAISAVQLAEGLHEQTTRKLAHLFTLPSSTTYAFEAEVDRLPSWGGGDWPHVDPTVAVWRGVRDGFAEEDIDTALLRQAKHAYRLATAADPKRFDLTTDEITAVECLRARALTLDELVGRAALDPKRARALVYFLMVTKQAESLDTSGVRAAYRPSSDQNPAVAPHTKPTVREMPAVGSAPRITAAREPTESAKWRAVAPVTGYSSSTKIEVAPAVPAESAKMPAARSTGSVAPSSAPRITMGGVQPSSPPQRRLSPPPLPLDLPRMRQSPPPIPFDLPKHQSSGQFNSKVVAELAGRRQSIADRAQAVLKEDYFQRLSLPRDAKASQVEEAFQALKTLWDPELLPPALAEAKDDCSFVMSCLVEAYTTLRDALPRDEYVRRVSTSNLRAQGDQYAEDLVASGKDDPGAGAQACFARGDLERAERLAKRAVKANPEAAAPLALLAWLEASKPTNVSLEETRKRIAMLDRALRIDEQMEQAHYWRGLLHKRLDNHNAAMSSFRKVVEINPKHMDAVRELRVYEMRIRRNSLTMKAVR